MLFRIFMAFSLTVGNEPHATLESADKLLVIVMAADMDAQVAAFREGFGANWAFVRFFFGVNPHMCFQGVVPGKSIFTDFTLERLQLCMNAIMVFQVPLGRELFAAAREKAAERLDAVMLVHMII